jgi:hypothetical protein
MVSPLDEWRFLVGEWQGETKDQFGEAENIKDTSIYSLDPSNSFIMEKREAWSGSRLVNKSISLMFYDGAEKKLKRKTFFSYGFVNNEVEYLRNEKEVRFEITMEPLSKELQSTRWRSFIRKISEDRIAVGLEMAKEGEDFKSYGEAIMVKTKN